MVKYKNSNNNSLTDREYEVLQYVQKGLTNREIAEVLMITHHTVKAHIASILRKIGAKNRLEASMIARDLGLCNTNLHQDLVLP